MLQGWTTKTAQELDATIRTWGEILSRYRIPLEQYHSLYWRAFDVRQGKLQNGGDVPDFDATLLVSQWTGQNGLERELHQRRVESGKYLPDTARTQCTKCNGSGWKHIGEGRHAPVAKCDHT